MARCIRCNVSSGALFRCEYCDEPSCKKCWVDASGPIGGIYCPNCGKKREGQIWDLGKR